MSAKANEMVDVVAVKRLMNESATISKRGFSWRATPYLRLTLACGHTVTRPEGGRPSPNKAKCKNGCLRTNANPSEDK